MLRFLKYKISGHNIKTINYNAHLEKIYFQKKKEIIFLKFIIVH